MLDTSRIRIHREHLAPFAQKVNQVPPIPAPRVEHPHPRRNVPAQNLIEYVNINLPELFLNRQRHCSTAFVKHI